MISKRIFELETETAFAVLAKANKLQAEGKNIINLGIGQPDFKTPENIYLLAQKINNEIAEDIDTENIVKKVETDVRDALIGEGVLGFLLRGDFLVEELALEFVWHLAEVLGYQEIHVLRQAGDRHSAFL